MLRWTNTKKQKIMLRGTNTTKPNKCWTEQKMLRGKYPKAKKCWEDQIPQNQKILREADTNKPIDEMIIKWNQGSRNYWEDQIPQGQKMLRGTDVTNQKGWEAQIPQNKIAERSRYKKGKNAEKRKYNKCLTILRETIARKAKILKGQNTTKPKHAEIIKNQKKCFERSKYHNAKTILRGSNTASPKMMRGTNTTKPKMLRGTKTTSQQNT